MSTHKDFHYIATNQYYTRRYKLNLPSLPDIPIIVYAECSPNTERLNNHYYSLDILFSVGEYPTRDFVIGVSFGDVQMEKDRVDSEIDSWVEQTINNETFPDVVQDYLDKEQMWEDYNENEIKSNGKDV